MTALVALTLLLAGPPPAWEKLYERPEKDRWMLAVWADDSGWFASGPGLLLTGDGKSVGRRELGERAIVGFSGASRAQLYAIGWDELVMKLEGDRWVEEHFAPRPRKGKRGRDTDDLLQTVVLLPGSRPVLAAVGPSRLLARTDRSWQALPESERQATLTMAHVGPKEARPPGCDVASWNWGRNDDALFSCHDGRSFRYQAGKAAPAGKLPPACQDAVDHGRLRGADAYTLCAGQLWRSDGTGWERVLGPAGMRDYAVTDRCLYAVTERAVWRRCAPPAN